MRKTRPAWQAGRVNALGGKLHDGELPLDAARREVREEAGVDVDRWEEFLVWHDLEYRLRAVRAFDDATGAAVMSVRARKVSSVMQVRVSGKNAPRQG